MFDSSLGLGPWSFPSDNPEKAKWANSYATLYRAAA